MKAFDRALSLEIDRLHFELDCICYKRGWKMALYRWWLRWQLKRAERRIPG